MQREDLENALMLGFEKLERSHAFDTVLYLNPFHKLSAGREMVLKSVNYVQPDRVLALEGGWVEKKRFGMQLDVASQETDLLALTTGESAFDLALVNLYRETDLSKSLIDTVLAKVGPHGIALFAAPNKLGGKKFESYLRDKKLPGFGSLSKHKCRVFWSFGVEDSAPEISTLDEVYGVPATRSPLGYETLPGVFGRGKDDDASLFLLETLGTRLNKLSGHGYDLGCGAGLLSVELLKRHPSPENLNLHLYDSQYRALCCAKWNLDAVLYPKHDQDAKPLEAQEPGKPQGSVSLHWADVSKELPGNYADFILMNPPFHDASGFEDVGIGARMIQAALKCLKPRGQFWFVANRHLPYEKKLDLDFVKWTTLNENRYYKVVQLTH